MVFALTANTSRPAANRPWSGLFANVSPSMTISLNGLKATPREVYAACLAAWRTGAEGNYNAFAERLAQPDPTLAMLQQVTSRTPNLTLALIVTLPIVFMIEIGSMGTDDRGSELSPATLIKVGGLYRKLIDQGQWWRLFTSTILHANFLHLAVNCIALFLVGQMLERLVGATWLGAIFAVSALCGAVVSYFTIPYQAVSSGASGAIVGLAAAAVVIARRYPPGALRASLDKWAALVLVTSLIPSGRAIAGLAHTDYAAHYGGAIGGVIMGLIVLALWRHDGPRPRGMTVAAIVAVAYAICVIVSIVLAARS